MQRSLMEFPMRSISVRELPICTMQVSFTKVGLSKWRNEGFPLTEIGEFVHRTELIGATASMRLYTFSKTGFSNACWDYAKEHSNVEFVLFE